MVVANLTTLRNQKEIADQVIHLQGAIISQSILPHQEAIRGRVDLVAPHIQDDLHRHQNQAVDLPGADPDHLLLHEAAEASFTRDTIFKSTKFADQSPADLQLIKL